MHGIARRTKVGSRYHHKLHAGRDEIAGEDKGGVLELAESTIEVTFDTKHGSTWRKGTVKERVGCRRLHEFGRKGSLQQTHASNDTKRSSA